MAALCRCICGHEERYDVPAPTMPPLEEVEEPLEQLNGRGRRAFSMSPEQKLRGAPIREGDLWHLSTEDRVDQVKVFLHVNGFRFRTDGQEVSISLSPFTLVRNCKFQSTHAGLNFSEFKIFKISLFAQGACYYFGIRGVSERLAEEERSRWVLDVSRIMRLVTQSLFPPFRISCTPLTLEPTQSRLMAGYLVHFDDCFTASVLYCELHVNAQDHARFIFYEDESCSQQLSEMFITERSLCCEKIGINCSCFSVEEHQFTARSLAERKLWLRAISNLKVKLQNGAPPPSEQETRHYRASIQEHVAKIHVLDALKTDALLSRAEAPVWRPPPACEDPPLGTLPSPPSPMDLRIAARPPEPSPRLQRSSSLIEPAEPREALGRNRSKSFEQPRKPEG